MGRRMSKVEEPGWGPWGLPGRPELLRPCGPWTRKAKVARRRRARHPPTHPHPGTHHHHQGRSHQPSPLQTCPRRSFMQSTNFHSAALCQVLRI